MKNYIRLMRPQHYLKNALILFPLLFSGSIFNRSKLITSLFAVLAFCCAASSVYIINDIRDKEKEITNQVEEIIESFTYINSLSSVKIDIVTPIIKVIGVGYITEFTADLAEDSGNKNIADKIIVGGKVAICLLAVPIVKSLVETIIALI